MSLGATVVNFQTSAFVPLALGFFGLGTGYLIYGPQELAGYPQRDRRVDISTGIWGILMPGFLQFVTGILLFVGLTWFSSFTDKPLTWRLSRSPLTAFTGGHSGSAGPLEAIRARTRSWRSRSSCCRLSARSCSSALTTIRSGHCSSGMRSLHGTGRHRRAHGQGRNPPRPGQALVAATRSPFAGLSPSRR